MELVGITLASDYVVCTLTTVVNADMNFFFTNCLLTCCLRYVCSVA